MVPGVLRIIVWTAEIHLNLGPSSGDGEAAGARTWTACLCNPGTWRRHPLGPLTDFLGFPSKRNDGLTDLSSTRMLPCGFIANQIPTHGTAQTHYPSRLFVLRAPFPGKGHNLCGYLSFTPLHGSGIPSRRSHVAEVGYSSPKLASGSGSWVMKYLPANASPGSSTGGVLVDGVGTGDIVAGWGIDDPRLNAAGGGVPWGVVLHVREWSTAPVGAISATDTTGMFVYL